MRCLGQQFLSFTVTVSQGWNQWIKEKKKAQALKQRKKTAKEGQSKLINKTRAWREELLCQNINISLPLLSLMWCEELIKGKCSSVPGVHPHNHVGSSVQHNQCSHAHINSSLLETNVMYQVIKGKAGIYSGYYNSYLTGPGAALH